ncbi:wdr41-related [Anaeramoeba ignava]|uniref:Wdr41-related n=1 Tax=Anaeramoeba ignava TaxID=1746090 RepID=A0A9Q0LQH2_ANAIG|nr:wdr41-related [Anaeramoeba ignava]
MGNKFQNSENQQQNTIKNKKYWQARQNPVTELQIMDAHKSGVKFILPLDKQLMASFDEDGEVIIWNYKFGSKVATLPKEHGGKITAAILLEDRQVLVTASADSTIKIWPLSKYTEQVVRTLKKHKSPVLFLLHLNENLFCSVSQEMIIVWRVDNFTALSKIPTTSTEDQLIFAITTKDNYLVITSKKKIYLYDLSPGFFKYETCLLSETPEDITYLASITDSLFACGFSNGTIMFWETDTFNQAQKRVVSVDHQKPPINYIYPFHFDKTYIAVAVGNSIAVYGSGDWKREIFIPNAHDSQIHYLAPLYRGYGIVSSSKDGEIKIWSVERFFDQPLTKAPTKSKKNSAKSTDTTSITGPNLSDKDREHCLIEKLPPIHTDKINQLISLNNFMFATSSDDKTIIVWKDEIYEQNFRNEIARSSLFHYSLDHLEEIQSQNVENDIFSQIHSKDNFIQFEQMESELEFLYNQIQAQEDMINDNFANDEHNDNDNDIDIDNDNDNQKEIDLNLDLMNEKSNLDNKV